MREIKPTLSKFVNTNFYPEHKYKIFNREIIMYVSKHCPLIRLSRHFHQTKRDYMALGKPSQIYNSPINLISIPFYFRVNRSVPNSFGEVLVLKISLPDNFEFASKAKKQNANTRIDRGFREGAIEQNAKEDWYGFRALMMELFWVGSVFILWESRKKVEKG